ncbi:MAG: Hsp70 family protein [Phototrophicaceae bacterium]
MIIGMDFGTTNSGMSVYNGEQLRLIPLDPHNRNATVARTALYITNDRAVHIGRDATDVYYEQNLNRPSKIEDVWVGEIEQTFAELPTFYRDVYIKKDIYAPGRLFLSFKMGLSSPNYVGTIVGSQYFFLEDIIATYLYVTKQRAEAHLQQSVDEIIFGRPVRYSDDPQQNEFAKERMVQAAFNAGYKTVYLQYEPIAAAYYYEMSITDEQNVLIFDFGGGTLDLSIVRVGNPKTRQVIANGGIPIAGDVFDQRIVREKYPKHFGEGSRYLSGNTELDMPPSFFDAFSDWQTMLSLQDLGTMERLKQIEATSKQRYKIQNLRKLITGHYGLKMFDIAEQSKRDLSQQHIARLDMEGDDFRVYDSITRREFEKLIRSDVRAIEARLDDILTMAGLDNNAIDAVIRTGGSSQIPIFVNLLQERFGADKVRDIDAFGSVTSGLGIIGHQIEHGRSDLNAYHAADYIGRRSLRAEKRSSVPIVNLDVIKRIIDVQESDETVSQQTKVLLMRDKKQQLYARYVDDLEAIHLSIPLDELDDGSFIQLVDANAKLVLMTTDYKCYVKQASDLADLVANDLHIEELEGFRRDDFSHEHVYSVMMWDAIADKDIVAVISSLGYTQKYFGHRLLDKMDRPIAYQIERKRGYPAFLVGANDDDDFVAITQAGRAGRINAKQLPLRDNRLLSFSMSNRVISMLGTQANDDLLIITQSGYAKRIMVNEIARIDAMNTTGVKIMQRSNPIIAIPYRPQKQHWAVSNQRIIAIDAHQIPLENLNKTDHRILNPKSNEKLLTIITS